MSGEERRCQRSSSRSPVRSRLCSSTSSPPASSAFHRPPSPRRASRKCGARKAPELNRLQSGCDGEDGGAGRKRGDRESRGSSTARGVSNSPSGSVGERSSTGFVSSMAADPAFQTFPDAADDPEQSAHEPAVLSDSDRFLQKQYPMLCMNVSAREHPSIDDVRYETAPPRCVLCKRLDKNTLDSIGVLKPHQVTAYLNLCGNAFTDKQVNVHLCHSDENAIGVLQNMSLDLIAKSYSLASDSSLRVMNRVQMHMGRVFSVPDQDMAKVHNDAVKQFVALAAACQSLMKHKQSEAEKGASLCSPSSAHPLL